MKSSSSFSSALASLYSATHLPARTPATSNHEKGGVVRCHSQNARERLRRRRRERRRRPRQPREREKRCAPSRVACRAGDPSENHLKRGPRATDSRGASRVVESRGEVAGLPATLRVTAVRREAPLGGVGESSGDSTHRAARAARSARHFSNEHDLYVSSARHGPRSSTCPPPAATTASCAPTTSPRSQADPVSCRRDGGDSQSLRGTVPARRSWRHMFLSSSLATRVPRPARRRRRFASAMESHARRSIAMSCETSTSEPS